MGWVDDALGSHEEPCVLSSSLQCGDQWSEVTDVCRDIVCSGFMIDGALGVDEDDDGGLEGVVVRDLMLNILILPSG